MGSYDKAPADWDELTGMPWVALHVIHCNSGWLGRERHDHQDVAEVRSCYRAARDEKAGIQVWECEWLLLGHYDDGSEYSYPCGAPARANDRGFSCEAGHEHVRAEVRCAEGWDYAADEGEAELLRRYGTDAVSMRGDSI